MRQIIKQETLSRIELVESRSGGGILDHITAKRRRLLTGLINAAYHGNRLTRGECLSDLLVEIRNWR